MATTRDVLASMAIRIGVDSASMSKSLNKITSDMNVFKNGIKELGAYIGGAFAARSIIEFGKESYNAYQYQLKQEQLLLTALQGRKDIQEGLIAQAKYLSHITLFTDEEIISGQKMIATFGLTADQMKLVSSAAVNLSTSLGIDLGEAMKMLARTYGGSARGLGQLIPEIAKMTKEQRMAGEAIIWVNEHMKDLAKTAANTDPVNQMTKAWKELKESFGKVIAPEITREASNWNKILTVIGSDKVPAKSKWWAMMMDMRQIPILYDQIIKSEADSKAADDVKAKSGFKVVETIASLKVELNELRTERENLDITDKNGLDTNGKEIIALEAKIKKYEDLGKAIKLLSDIDRKKSLESMTKDVNTSYYDTTNVTALKSIPGQVGSSWDKKTGKITNPMPQLNFPDMKERWNQTKKDYKDFTKEMADLTEKMTDTIQAGISNMAVSFGESLGKMMASGGKFDISNVLDAMASMIGQLGKMAIETGVAMLAIKAALKFKNPYVAIAAGIALVALSAAIKAGASRMADGGSSSSASLHSGASSGSSSDYTFNRNLGDLQPITVNVMIDDEAIRRSNIRATVKHKNGY